MNKLLIFAIMLIAATATATASNAPKQVNDTTIVLIVNPPMHCGNCEKKIKSNIRFERGVKSIETDREKQTVTIRADKSKLDAERLRKAFARIGYEVR